MLTHGVAEGLRGFLMKGHNPAGLLHLHLDPAEVDVNVHPTKQEVRFRRSRDIHQLIVQAIRQGMQEYQQTIKNSFFTPPAVQSGTTSAYREPLPPSHPVQPRKIFPGPTKQEPPQQPAFSQPAQPATAEPVVPPPSEPSRPQQRPASPEPETVFNSQPPQGHGLKVIGQYDNLYIFCQSADGLIVIDQHAAHERLLFEKLKQQFLHGTIARQTLLFPETVELSVADTQKVEQYGDEIDKMGFTIREFGGSSYVISAVPALGNHLTPSELFLDILEQFGSSESGKRKGSLLEDVLASMACKAAVKAGDALPPEEIEALLNNMAKADLFSHCPHGRPVLKQFLASDIKKWFHRT